MTIKEGHAMIFPLSGGAESGDENGKGYVVIIVFAILAAIIIKEYFWPGSGDPF